MGEHVDWALHRTEMADRHGRRSPRPSTATPSSPLREREAARWTIALINHCVVCQDTAPRRARARRRRGLLRRGCQLADQHRPVRPERLAAEFAERFALDHQAMDDALWARLVVPSPTTSWPT